MTKPEQSLLEELCLAIEDAAVNGELSGDYENSSGAYLPEARACLEVMKKRVDAKADEWEAKGENFDKCGCGEPGEHLLLIRAANELRDLFTLKDVAGGG
jgi:hypothetical protein